MTYIYRKEILIKIIFRYWYTELMC